MINKSTQAKQEVEALTIFIQEWMKSFMRKSRKTQGDLYVELQCVEYDVRNKKVKRILNEIIDIIHEKNYGYSNIRPEINEFDILNAEFLEVTNDYQ